MARDSTIYFQASLFRCEFCSYETEIYYNEEYLKEGVDDLCACNRAGHYKFSPILINRDDLDDIVLPGQFACLPEDKNFCTACLGKALVSWKDVVPLCIKYGKTSMTFIMRTINSSTSQILNILGVTEFTIFREEEMERAFQRILID